MFLYYRKIVPKTETQMNEDVASFISVKKLRSIMTEKGKMKLSGEEFDSLMRRTAHANTGVVNYKTIIDQFTKDFEKVNIIRNL